MSRHDVRLPDALSTLRDGDLLLFRGQGLVARLIRTAGRSAYSHAAMVAWWHEIPMCLEIRELRGGRAVTLASQVHAFPGSIDVFGVREEFDAFNRDGAVREMILRAGSRYGWSHIAWASLVHLPLVRLLVTPDDNDDGGLSGTPQFCSEAIASAARIGGGIDPVPFASDRITEPGDLARSILWKYRYTLIP